MLPAGESECKESEEKSTQNKGFTARWSESAQHSSCNTLPYTNTVCFAAHPLRAAQKALLHTFQQQPCSHGLTLGVPLSSVFHQQAQQAKAVFVMSILCLLRKQGTTKVLRCCHLTWPNRSECCSSHLFITQGSFSSFQRVLQVCMEHSNSWTYLQNTQMCIYPLCYCSIRKSMKTSEKRYCQYAAHKGNSQASESPTATYQQPKQPQGPPPKEGVSPTTVSHKLDTGTFPCATKPRRENQAPANEPCLEQKRPADPRLAVTTAISRGCTYW